MFVRYVINVDGSFLLKKGMFLHYERNVDESSQHRGGDVSTLCL